MSPLDSLDLSEPLSATAPSGPNLEYDPEFADLVRAAQRKPEQQVGATIIPAEEPDWRSVVTQARALLARTRDLRVVQHLAVGRLHVEGIAAFARTLSEIRTLLADRWADIHPQLDPEDDNDPTLRANVLKDLGQFRSVLEFLRDVPLVGSSRVGPFSWRQIAMASGEIDTPADAVRPGEGEVRGAFRDETAPDQLASLRAAIKEALAGARGIVTTFEGQAGATTGPNLDELEEVLARIDRTLDRYAGEMPAPAEEAMSAPAVPPAADAAAPVVPAGGRSAVTAASLGEITTRADALRLLDLVCRYYERFEPSSPLPLLIERARRLADKDFLAVLRDLAPDGLGQAQLVINSRDDM